MPLKKDIITFIEKQPIAAIVIAVPFAIMAFSAFTTGYLTGKAADSLPSRPWRLLPGYGLK
jgi:hypothetical protein